MADDDAFYSPNHKPAGPRQAQPGELVWEAHIRGRFYRCELRDHGQWGVEAQVLLDHDLFYARRFSTRAAALAFAEEERIDLSRRGDE
jgi:hypothetical protein